MQIRCYVYLFDISIANTEHSDKGIIVISLGYDICLLWREGGGRGI